MRIESFKKSKILIDRSDLKKVSSFCWWIKPNGYVYTQVNRKTIYLHRLLLETTDGIEVDHINRNKLDNRRTNLRLCTRSQNNMNKSGVRGVSRFKGKWRARIKKDRKEIHIGVFNFYEEALVARKKVESDLFGKFANV